MSYITPLPAAVLLLLLAIPVTVAAQDEPDTHTPLDRLFHVVRDGEDSDRPLAVWSLLRLQLNEDWDLTPAIDATRHGELHLQRLGAEVLGRAANSAQRKHAIEALEHLIEEDHDYFAVYSALESLVGLNALTQKEAADRIDQTAERKTRTYLKAALDDLDPTDWLELVSEINRKAAERLYRLGDADRATQRWVFSRLAKLESDERSPLSYDVPAAAVAPLIRIASGNAPGIPDALTALGELGPEARPAEKVLISHITNSRVADEPTTDLHRQLRDCGVELNRQDAFLIAIDALGRVAENRAAAVQVLRKELKRDRHRAALAASSLARLGDPAGLTVLRSELNLSRQSVPTRAIGVLGCIGHLEEKAAPAIGDILNVCRSHSGEVHEAAGIALARIGEPALPQMFAEFDKGNDELQIALCESLRIMEPFPEQVPRALTKRLGSVPDRVKPYIGLCLAEGGAPTDEVAKIMVGLCDSKEIGIRQMAAYALSQMTPPPETLPALSRLCRHKDTTVGGMVAEAIGRMQERAIPALPTLLKIVRENTQYVAGQTIVALGGIPSDKSLDELTRQLGNENVGYRINTTVALLKLRRRTPECVAALRKAMREDKEPHVRARAAIALLALELHADEAVQRIRREIWEAPAIGGFFTSMMPEMVASSLGSLGAAGRPAIPLLELFLKDPAPGVRLNAAASLAQIDPNRTEELISPVLRGLRNSDAGVRQSAISALRFIHHPDADRALQLATEDSDVSVQRQAWRVIRTRRRENAAD